MKSGTVSGLMPTGIRRRGIKHSIDGKGNHRPPSAPESKSGVTRTKDQGKPEDRITKRGSVAPNQKLAHFFARNRTLIPICFRQAAFDGQVRIYAGQTVIKFSGWFGQSEGVVAHNRDSQNKAFCGADVFSPDDKSQSLTKYLPYSPVRSAVCTVGRTASANSAAEVFFSRLHCRAAPVMAQLTMVAFSSGLVTPSARNSSNRNSRMMAFTWDSTIGSNCR